MSIDPQKTDHESDDTIAHRSDDAGGAESVGSPPTETHNHPSTLGAQGIPNRIGQYHIKRPIATGGMGTVYEAVQEKPRRTVAVKLMRAGVASRSALRRFEYESTARQASSSRHRPSLRRRDPS